MRQLRDETASRAIKKISKSQGKKRTNRFKTDEKRVKKCSANDAAEAEVQNYRNVEIKITSTWCMHFPAPGYKIYRKSPQCYYPTQSPASNYTKL